MDCCWKSTKILVSADSFWVTTLVGGGVWQNLLNPSGCSYLSLPLFLSPLFPSPILRCWDPVLCRQLITRVTQGRDEGRSPSGSDSCLCRPADCRRALPAVCDKCRCHWQKWCHRDSSLCLNYSKPRNEERLLALFFFSLYCSCLLLFSSWLSFLSTTISNSYLNVFNTTFSHFTHMYREMVHEGCF